MNTKKSTAPLRPVEESRKYFLGVVSNKNVAQDYQPVFTNGEERSRVYIGEKSKALFLSDLYRSSVRAKEEPGTVILLNTKQYELEHIVPEIEEAADISIVNMNMALSEPDSSADCYIITPGSKSSDQCSTWLRSNKQMTLHIYFKELTEKAVEVINSLHMNDILTFDVEGNEKLLRHYDAVPGEEDDIVNVLINEGSAEVITCCHPKAKTMRMFRKELKTPSAIPEEEVFSLSLVFECGPITAIVEAPAYYSVKPCDDIEQLMTTEASRYKIVINTRDAYLKRTSGAVTTRQPLFGSRSAKTEMYVDLRKVKNIDTLQWAFNGERLNELKEETDLVTIPYERWETKEALLKMVEKAGLVPQFMMTQKIIRKETQL